MSDKQPNPQKPSAAEKIAELESKLAEAEAKAAEAEQKAQDAEAKVSASDAALERERAAKAAGLFVPPATAEPKRKNQPLRLPSSAKRDPIKDADPTLRWRASGRSFGHYQKIS